MTEKDGDRERMSKTCSKQTTDDECLEDLSLFILSRVSYLFSLLLSGGMFECHYCILAVFLPNYVVKQVGKMHCIS